MGTEIFGLKMGMTVNELEIEKQFSEDAYLLFVVPKPHSAFESYLVTISDIYGLVCITALSHTKNSPPDGSALRHEYFSMRNKLERKYGLFIEIDELNEYSIWDEESDFMRSLECSDRDLFAFWDIETLKGNPDAKTLSCVYLSAKSDEDLNGYLSLTYRFMNYDKYFEEKAEAEDENL